MLGNGDVQAVIQYAPDRTTSLPQGKYSFRLYFRGDYGEGRLQQPIFPEVPVGSFDTIVLRAGMNDATNPFLRDEFARRLEADVGQVSARGTFVHLFLNGVYKGYYNPCERIEEGFLQSWHGGGTSWDILTVNNAVQGGDNVAFNQLLRALEEGNENVSAGILNQRGAEWLVTGIGRVRSTNDIAATVVTARDGVPTLIRVAP